MLFRAWVCLLLAGALRAGGAPARVPPRMPADSLRPVPTRRPGPPPADVVDALNVAAPRLRLAPHDSLALARGHKFLALLPAVGYSQQTGVLAEVAASVAFRRPGANMSTVLGALIYTARAQAIATVAASVWAADNRWNFVSDYRVMRYPQSTYGLGMHTSTTEQVTTMDYDYLRAYQSALRRLGPSFYAGLGVQLDDHWNIVSRNGARQVRTISHYRDGVQGRSLSVGPTLNLLYDSRANAINPAGGAYFSAVFRPNRQALGSTTNYETLLLEGRAYLHPSRRSANVLAFWSYNALTLRGNPPFLDLPSTGWDMSSNLGRGYIQGRFRGKNLLYFESEYRFGLTRNRLLGGVVFANAQAVSEDAQRPDEPISKRYDKVAPALGVGLRLNLNKVSRTNLAIDYARGIQGSSSLSFNVGEVF